MWRLVGLLLCMSCSVAMAEPVVLVSKDGYVAFSGDLVDVDERFYVLRTSVGEVKIPVADVICTGSGCPVTSTSSVGQIPSEPGLDEKDKLFQLFLEWREKNADPQDPNDELFRRFLEWRENNTN